MIKFGTGGWRAIIGEEFTKENIQKLALVAGEPSFGDVFTKENILKLALAMSLKIKGEHVEDMPVLIGFDRRFLS